MTKQGLKQIYSRMFKIARNQISDFIKDFLDIFLYVCKGCFVLAGALCLIMSFGSFIFGGLDQHTAFLCHIGSVIAIIGCLAFWLYKVYLQAKSGE